jgi:hypothetical protein
MENQNQHLHEVAITAIIIKDVRINDTSFLSSHKSLNFYLYNYFKNRAEAQGRQEAIILNTKGFISEGSRSNIFIIKNNNTGAIDDVDSYTITTISKNHWPLISRENIKNLQIGNSTEPDDARVVIQVPKNTTLDSDIITITVTSEGNPSVTATINVTVHVIGNDVLERYALCLHVGQVQSPLVECRTEGDSAIFNCNLPVFLVFWWRDTSR